MKRRNPATASSPNPQFEMTSFMDIIFIFLFVVMIGYAIKCAQESDAASDKMTEADRKLAEAQQVLEEANRTLEKAADEHADIQIYEQQIEELTGTVVGRRVLIVSISCRYDADDIEHPEEWQRHLRVLDTNRQMLLERDFKDGSVKSTYDKLREVLTAYVEGVKKADQEQAGRYYDTDKQARTVIVFSIDRTEGGILTGDYESIMGVIGELESAYDDVY